MAAWKNIPETRNIYFFTFTLHFVYLQRTHKDHKVTAPGVGADWVLAAGDESEFCQYPGVADQRPAHH